MARLTLLGTIGETSINDDGIGAKELRVSANQSIKVARFEKIQYFTILPHAKARSCKVEDGFLRDLRTFV